MESMQDGIKTYIQVSDNISNKDTCHQLISHPEKIEKRAEKPLKIILL